MSKIKNSLTAPKAPYNYTRYVVDTASKPRGNRTHPGFLKIRRRVLILREYYTLDNVETVPKSLENKTFFNTSTGLSILREHSSK